MVKPRLAEKHLDPANVGKEQTAMCGPYINPNTGQFFAAFTDEHRRKMDDLIMEQGNTIYKRSTPMSDPMKLRLFKQKPNEPTLGAYAIDMQAWGIVNDPCRTLSTDNGKTRGEKVAPNVLVRYEYAESCFHNGRTDRLMAHSHEVMNIRDVMGRTPWKNLDELILGDYERMRAGRIGIFSNLQ